MISAYIVLARSMSEKKELDALLKQQREELNNLASQIEFENMMKNVELKESSANGVRKK